MKLLLAFSHLCCLLPSLCNFGLAALPYDSDDSDCFTNGSTSLLQAKFELVAHAEKDQDVSTRVVRFLPEHNVLLHSCAKCGSSSLFEFVYKIYFGNQSFQTLQDNVQNASMWKGRMVAVDIETAARLNAGPNVFSLALIRDPRERIVSAWKSKVTCDADCWDTDVLDRDSMVPELLALAGITSQAKCLSFSDFIDVLYSVHSQGKDRQLNEHFVPQHVDFFEKIPLEKWSVLTKISNNSAAKALGEHLGIRNVTGMQFPLSHVSKAHHGTTNCSDDHLLDSTSTFQKVKLLTTPEYVALGLDSEEAQAL